MNEDEILAALQSMNHGRCNPPLDDAEVEKLAASAAGYEPGPPAMEGKDGPDLVTLRQLMDEPAADTQWLVEGLLPTGGFSLMSAKIKVGKSTLARQAALAVARGEPFLGRTTTQGPVIYVAMEEKRDQVPRHFRDMAASGDEPIHIHVAAAPEDAIAWLRRHIERVRPVLAILDPILRFTRPCSR